MIADNRLTDNSIGDDRLLAKQLKELSVLDLDFTTVSESRPRSCVFICDDEDRIHRTLAALCAILANFAMLTLCGCELPVIAGGAVYATIHGPDPLTQAYASLRGHDCSAADSEFSSALETNPNDARAVSGKADALLCLGKYDDAIAEYTRAIELDPKWFDYLGRGVAYKATGDQGKALQSFDEGIANNPKMPSLYIYRGAVQTARGDSSAAKSDLDKVSSLISKRYGLFNAYAWTLATSPIAAFRDGPAAIQYAQRACDLDSWKNAKIVDTLAAAYAEAGQFDQAVKWQTTAIQLEAKKDPVFDARLAMYQRHEPYRSKRLFGIFEFFGLREKVISNRQIASAR